MLFDDTDRVVKKPVFWFVIGVTVSVITTAVAGFLAVTSSWERVRP
ncbi:MAG TPA: hypothetical protein VN647_08960 [Nitrospira sp.]|nr:hypothetical protein [Nitrospira sp.]